MMVVMFWRLAVAMMTKRLWRQCFGKTDWYARLQLGVAGTHAKHVGSCSVGSVEAGDGTK